MSDEKQLVDLNMDANNAGFKMLQKWPCKCISERRHIQHVSWLQGHTQCFWFDAQNVMFIYKKSVQGSFSVCHLKLLCQVIWLSPC